MAITTITSKIVNFSPNEAAAYSDQTDIQKALTQRAWEFPDYSNVLSADWFVHGAPSYGGVFGAPTDLKKLVFTKGAGLSLISSGFDVQVYPGFLGIYPGAAGPVEFSLAAPTPSMRWGAVALTGGVSPGTIAVANPGGALEMYSLIEASFTETASETTARHFKDAATGALSSASTAKRRGLPLTISVNNGSAAAAGTAVIPTLTAGKSLIGYTRQTAAGIQEVFDCTIPFGPMMEKVFFGRDCYHSNATESSSGRVLTFGAGVGVAQYFLASNPRERVVGIRILHALTSGATLGLNRNQDNTAADIGTIPFLLTGGTDFPADGTKRELVINTMGAPIASGGVIRPPVWGAGYHFKHDGGLESFSNETLGLGVITSSACAIYGVRLHSVIA